MGNVLLLYVGEVMRMRRYGITLASLGASVLWILILHFGEFGNISAFFPLVLFIDTTLMSLLLVGTSMMFEKGENATKSMLVLPISKDDYLLSKAFGAMTSSVTTLVILLIYSVLVQDLRINIPGILGAVLLSSFVFAQIGILITYWSRDFTALLMGMMKFSLLFAIPTILQYVNLLTGDWVDYVQYLNPTRNALVLLLAPATYVNAKDMWIAVAYLVVAGTLLYIAARKAFDNYAMKESGG